ncbi:hypothetical protein OH76DRAFT_1298639, partial [Lentinus brumalis]
VDPWTKDWEAFCKTGKGHPIAPRWHQWVGALGMMLRVIRDGVPVLLLDDDGIGKTMQVLMVIALYQLFRRHREKHGRFPGAFAKYKCKTPDGNLPDRPHMIVVPTCLKEQWEGEIHRFLRWGAFDLIPYQ